MAKKAIITGITGQDGSFLAELLISKGYEVHGIVRRVAIQDPKQRYWRIKKNLKKLHIHSGTMENYSSIFKVINKIKPDEFYHLAAQSFVSDSFNDEYSTLSSNINSTHYCLSAIKELGLKKTKFYFAGSSEMFGRVRESPQNESTPFHPRSIYGISKVAGFELTRYYREAFNMHASSGILFNHESERRGYEFVTRKISYSAAMIKLGLQKNLELGNLDAKRDWGYAPEYVNAMWLMLQDKKADDYVVGTGKAYSVRDFANIAFKILNMDYKKYLKIKKQLYRPSEVETLICDPSKIKKKFGWKTKVSFVELVERMVKNDYDELKRRV